MAKYLVTGGAGFIGSAIVRRLAADGHKVAVIDNLSTGSRDNLREVAGAITLVAGDILDRKALAKAMAGVDFVLHQAAIASVPASIANPQDTTRVNIDGTVAVLWEAKRAGVKRVVFASSCNVYGNHPAPLHQEDMPLDLFSAYGVSKYAGELYCQMFARAYGLPTVSLRYFNVYGPRQNPKAQYALVIPKFITAMLGGEKPVIFGDGSQVRDYVFIDDVVQANLLACKSAKADGKIINIGSGVGSSVNELVAKINTALGTSITAIHTKPRAGDPQSLCADTSRAKRLLGFAPKTTLDKGIRRTAEWYKLHAS